MPLIIITLIILLICAGLIMRIVLRRLPELKVLDISTVPKEKHDKTKSKILEAKFLRQKKTTTAKFHHLTAPAKEQFNNIVSGLKDRMLILEKKYKRQAEVEEIRTKSINELFINAKLNISANDYVMAEKDLIEVLARDKRNLEAYKLLADIYRLSKSYSQAEEVLRYIIKLKSLKYRKNKNVDMLKKEKMEDAEAEMLETIDVDGELAGYYDDLAKIYESMDKKDKALDSYLKANGILPNNPKYLDKIIDLAIAINDKGLATKTYKRLKEINPDNAKLIQFKIALDKLK